MLIVLTWLIFVLFFQIDLSSAYTSCLPPPLGPLPLAAPWMRTYLIDGLVVLVLLLILLGSQGVNNLSPIQNSASLHV